MGDKANKDSQKENGADVNDEEVADSEPVIFFGEAFSFSYPSTVSILEEEADGGELILANGGPNESFQLFVVPFDETGPITAERIKKDLPGLFIDNQKSIEVADVKALSFEGKDESGKKTFEVWFVSGGKLYQMMGYDEAKETIEDVLDSWEWVSGE